MLKSELIEQNKNLVKQNGELLYLLEFGKIRCEDSKHQMIWEQDSNAKVLHQKIQKQKEVIDKLKNKTKENIENAKCEITTLTIGDKAYYQYIEKILDNYVDILKEVE